MKPIKAWALVTPRGRIIDLKYGLEIYRSKSRLKQAWSLYPHLTQPILITKFFSKRKKK